ncbi:MAG TPA: hypothetical protein VGL66_14740 [Caulobacteraceae bacterium]|jgi:hypothetical protein
MKHELAQVAPSNRYALALGKFMQQFTQTEYQLVLLLRHFAGTSDEVGRAVFHGYRIDATKDAINRILDATGNMEAKVRLEEPFSRLGAINGMRNNIVHWGARWYGAPYGAPFLVSNDRIAHTPERLREYAIKPDTLAEMRIDLEKIEHLLREECSEKPFISAHLYDARIEPWLYIPLQPSRREKAPRDGSPPKRPRGRDASPNSPQKKRRD